MKDRGRQSMKEMISGNDKTTSEPQERIPNYITKPPKFFCPIGGWGIMWHHDLMYSSCPVNSGNRDMPACEKCIHKGSKLKPKNDRNDRQDEKKPIVEIVKKERVAVPKIGKTYTSE